jgi:hypothetical protein
MATELWKLRQQVEDLINSKSEFGSEYDDTQESQRQQRQSEDNSRMTSEDKDELEGNISK